MKSGINGWNENDHRANFDASCIATTSPATGDAPSLAGIAHARKTHASCAEWTAVMKRSITPRLIRCMTPFASGISDQVSSVSEQVSFPIMDLPPELRQLVRSYTSLGWYQELTRTPELMRISRPPSLLQVSRDVCNEVSKFVIFTLVIDHRRSPEPHDRVDIAAYSRHLELWLAASPQRIINSLSRLRLIIIAADQARFVFTFVVNRKGDLVLTRCRFPPTSGREGGWYPSKVVETVVTEALNDSVQKLMTQTAAKSIRGLRLFEIVLASEAIWQKLIHDNGRYMKKVVGAHLRTASKRVPVVGAADYRTVYWRWPNFERTEVFC